MKKNMVKKGIGDNFFEEAKKLFGGALMVAVIAGIISLLLGMFIPSQGDALVSILVSAAAIVILLVVIAYANSVRGMSLLVKKFKVFDLALFLGAIALIGSIVSYVFPPASVFILSIGQNLTISGLLWTFVYIAIAEIVIMHLRKWFD